MAAVPIATGTLLRCLWVEAIPWDALRAVTYRAPDVSSMLLEAVPAAQWVFGPVWGGPSVWWHPSLPCPALSPRTGWSLFFQAAVMERKLWGCGCSGLQVTGACDTQTGQQVCSPGPAPPMSLSGTVLGVLWPERRKDFGG